MEESRTKEVDGPRPVFLTRNSLQQEKSTRAHTEASVAVANTPEGS